jgi:ubiquinone/menaquinone biosynthesis C-methylase UbiE
MEDQFLSVQEYYSMASHYDYLLNHVDYERWFNYIKKNIEVWCKAQPQKILEIGTGTGRFGSKFSNSGFEIYGADISLDMLRAAKLRTFNNYRVFCADIRTIVTSINLNLSLPFMIR